MSLISVGNKHFANAVTAGTGQTLLPQPFISLMSSVVPQTNNVSVSFGHHFNTPSSALLPFHFSSPQTYFQYHNNYGYQCLPDMNIFRRPVHHDFSQSRKIDECIIPRTDFSSNKFGFLESSLASPDSFVSISSSGISNLVPVHSIPKITNNMVEIPVVSRMVSHNTLSMPQMAKTSFNVGYYVPPSVDPGDPFGGLEVVWKQHFSYLFSEYPEDIWSFGPKSPSEDLEDWAFFKDMAKVRFFCRNCTHGWTSMHGPVIFYYRFDTASRKGDVRFALTGQKCMKCQTIEFETPMWYPEEVQKVMTNLFIEITTKIYGKKDNPPLRRERRHGRPRQQHVSSSCEGCHLGFCKQSHQQDSTTK